MKSRRCKVCGLNKRSNQYYKSKAAKYYGICKPCVDSKKKSEKFFNTNEQRKMWRETYGEQKNVTTQRVMVSDDYAKFIPRKK